MIAHGPSPLAVIGRAHAGTATRDGEGLASISRRWQKPSTTSACSPLTWIEWK